MSTPAVPCVLPTYKIPNKKKAERTWDQLLYTVGMIVLPMILICLFLSSVYIGSGYLHEHLQNENAEANGNVGLRGTRNIIQKWSLSHLGGVDITNLGPPPVGKKHSTALLDEVNVLLHNKSPDIADNSHNTGGSNS